MRNGLRSGRLASGPGLAILVWIGGWAGTTAAAEPKVGERLERRGDEIVACGQFFHTTAPVVLWTDPGGYDAYRVERRFVPPEKATWAEAQAAGIRSPNRYGNRNAALPPEQVAKVHAGGWTLPDLQGVVDQFVIHFDVCGTSSRCFQVLHDARTLSVHFMLDVDGTIYQTLDLKERAYHATIANTRSIGIEIANMGAYPADKPAPALETWYGRDDKGRTRLNIPESARPESIRTRDTVFRPIRDEPVVGTIQGRELRQYDLTPQQYDSLTRLTATLCTVFPRIRCDYPRDPSGDVVPKKLDDDALKAYQGVLGHYHVQTNKVDPGPAFQWDRVIDGAKALMGPRSGGR
jgi:N-acetylmuramoyl-L-alanine amidase